MTPVKRVTKIGKKTRRSRKSASGGGGRKGGRRKGLSLSASADSSKRQVSMGDVLEFYKPIKKPVTLRLDADVLAWFRREGRRYQTRINSALRSLMEREMKGN
jgi:uncharacterized protein (DUF4415 family)